LKNSGPGFPRPVSGGPSAALRTGVGAASALLARSPDRRWLGLGQRPSPNECHCERSEAISTLEGDCFVAEFILSLSKGSSQ
jgi:hypothetical protein